MSLQGIGSALLLSCALVGVVSAAPQPDVRSSKPALYYFVIDRSGSIKQNHLVLPIRGALVEKLAQIPKQNAAVRVVLFNEKADRRIGWPEMDLRARGELEQWLGKNFVPAGDTRLFDTVAEALEEISQVKEAYSRIELTIFSDGVESPPISTRYRSWKDIEPLARGLKMSGPPFNGILYTLGYIPPEKPDPEFIETREVPDASEKIPMAEPQPEARFTVSPASGTVPFEVRFTDKSRGNVTRWEWDFGDSGKSDERSPRHIYRKTGAFSPRLTVTNGSGEQSKTAGDTVVQAKAPPPRWMRPALLLLGALLVWILIVVPFLLAPAMTPRRDASIRGDSTHSLVQLARKHRFRWLWPRGYVTVGGARRDGIPVSGGKPRLARIHRIFGARDYRVTALVDKAVATVRVDRDPTGRETRESKPLPRSQSVILRDGGVYEIGGKLFTWIHPDNRKRPTVKH